MFGADDKEWSVASSVGLFVIRAIKSGLDLVNGTVSQSNPGVAHYTHDLIALSFGITKLFVERVFSRPAEPCQRFVHDDGAGLFADICFVEIASSQDGDAHHAEQIVRPDASARAQK